MSLPMLPTGYDHVFFPHLLDSVVALKINILRIISAFKKTKPIEPAYRCKSSYMI